MKTRIEINISLLVMMLSISAFHSIGQCDGVCPESIIAETGNPAAFGFSIPGIDAGESVLWNFGDGTEMEDDYQFGHVYVPGDYTLTATFQDNDCPGNDPVVLSLEIPESWFDCTFEISYLLSDTCGVVHFSLDQPVQWDVIDWSFGDQIYAHEPGVTTHQYLETGSYAVCMTIASAYCLDSIPSCIQINLKECNVDCTVASVTINSDVLQNGASEVVLHIGPFPEPIVNPDVIFTPEFDSEIVEVSIQFCLPTDCFVFFAFPNEDFLNFDLTFELDGIISLVEYNFLCDQGNQCGTVCNPCPGSIHANQLDLNLFEFTVEGIDEDQPMTWNFGDGTEVVDDALIEHEFAEGTFLATATFMDADCPWDGPTILSTEVSVVVCINNLIFEDGVCVLDIPSLDAGTLVDFSINSSEYENFTLPIDLSFWFGIGDYELCVWNDSLCSAGCPMFCDSVYTENCYWSVEENGQVQLIVFPNPASEHLTITLDENPGQLEAKLIDSTGCIVLSQSISSRTTMIDVSRLSSGLYLLKLNGDAMNETRQVEIVR